MWWWAFNPLWVLAAFLFGAVVGFSAAVNWG